MHKVLSVVTVVTVLALGAASVQAGLDLQYLGAFRALAGAPQVYLGGLTYYPDGNQEAGSLFLSDAPTSGGVEVYELNIPALTITNDVNALVTASTLTSFDVNSSPHGLVWRSTNDKLYTSKEASGSKAIKYREINRDGTGESAERSGPAWREGGYGLTQIPDAWANAYAGDKNVVTVGPKYGVRLSSVDPWNAVPGQTPLVEYSSANKMVGYDYNDKFNALEWVSFGGEDNFIIAGEDASESAATLWFYDAQDIANAVNLYDPQPYRTMVVQDVLFGTDRQTLWGLTYDAANQIVYGYEGGWNMPVVVHAWSVVPEPATLALLAAGGVFVIRRRR